MKKIIIEKNHAGEGTVSKLTPKKLREEIGTEDFLYLISELKNRTVATYAADDIFYTVMV
jgi:hypothetical protein